MSQEEITSALQVVLVIELPGGEHHRRQPRGGKHMMENEPGEDAGKEWVHLRRTSKIRPDGMSL